MLIKNWKMDFGTHKSLDCVAPCDMYGVLLSHDLIKHPYYGLNEQELTDLSRQDSAFYSEFELDEDALSREHIELLFHGLDTICDIYFNGILLDSVQNMHRLYEYDIKALAKAKNEIRLEFKSPIEYFEKMESAHHLYTNTDSIEGAAHLRKALYMSGWDWAPKLPNMGIFRDVEIRAYDTDILGDIMITQRHENGQVFVEISASSKHLAKGVSIICELDSQKAVLKDGKATIKIENPRLWWPNGFGEQNLYDLHLSLLKGDCVLDTRTMTIGLRTLELSREDDEHGQEFCIKVNGIKIFAMGANFVPIESIPSHETNERLERLIQDCIFANFNCIRVWGGAYYPRDYFYELCDKYGLIVWQDFMVACANVWMRPEFEKEFKEEAIYNVKRIRHHASLGILCGNNEMEEAICGWPCADGNDPLVRSDYLKLYEDILPSICAEHAPFISYTPSSPTSGGNFNLPQDYTRGDVHFWHVWNGNCGFDEYRKHKFRFCSEYGFESLPCMKTVEAFCPSDEQNVLSYTMEWHQKHWHGNVKLVNYLADRYQLPKDLRATVYATQLNQACAIKYGVEHFRRCRGYTMGSIYWQLNDCWPVASWSSIDYYGRYKALHYYAKRFYSKIALGLFNEGDTVTVNVASESTEPFEGYIKYSVRRNDLSIISEGEKHFMLAPLSSLDVESVPNFEFNGHRDAYFYAELYDKNGKLIARNTELGAEPKHFKLLKPTVKVEIESVEGGALITLESDVLAKDVEISLKNHDIVLSDNYFDLASEAPYTVFAKTTLDKNELEGEISVFSVYDISK